MLAAAFLHTDFRLRYWFSLNIRYLLMKIGRQMKESPKCGAMFYSNPSNKCWFVSIQTNMMLFKALDEWGDHRCLFQILCQPIKCHGHQHGMVFLSKPRRLTQLLSLILALLCRLWQEHVLFFSSLALCLHWKTEIVFACVTPNFDLNLTTSQCKGNTNNLTHRTNFNTVT